MTPSDDAPACVPWPPLLIVLMLLDGGALAGLVSFSGAARLGALIVALAIANDLWCAAVFARLHTTIMPHRAASHLAMEGLFRWSRSPI